MKIKESINIIPIEIDMSLYKPGIDHSHRTNNHAFLYYADKVNTKVWIYYWNCIKSNISWKKLFK